MRGGTFVFAAGVLVAALLSAKSSRADDGGSVDAADDSASSRSEAGPAEATYAAPDAAEAGIFSSKNSSGNCSLSTDSPFPGGGSRAALYGLLAAVVLCVRRR